MQRNGKRPTTTHKKNETRRKIKKRTTKAHVVERQNLWK